MHTTLIYACGPVGAAAIELLRGASYSLHFNRQKLACFGYSVAEQCKLFYDPISNSGLRLL